MAGSPRNIVRDVLSRKMAEEIWSWQYNKAMPVSFNHFELSAVLPAVFYMFRFGQRRGRGKFLETFAPESGSTRERRRMATVERVAEKLSARPDLDGFDGEVEKAILGDLLLCFGLENARRDLGRNKQVQRVAPTHYMASWVDLPEDVVHLRFVPEMMVAMLADQKGDYVEPNDPTAGRRTWFPVAQGHEENLLLRAFSQGVKSRGRLADRAADRFDEEENGVGVDQLLMIRLAQELRAAPDKVRGGEVSKISNQRPIAEVAARHFSEDIRRFVRSYASVVPRHALTDMLESCVATGMTAILTSVVEILFDWSDTGHLPNRDSQWPACVLVDCSSGVDVKLRSLAEQSMDDLMRRVERIPVALMTLRLLDYAARDNRRIRSADIPTRPYATEWIDLLGELLHERHGEARFIHRTMDEHGIKLAKALEEDYPEAAEMFRNQQTQPNPVRRLAAALTMLSGGNAHRNLMGMVDSTLQIGRPNGLARKRTSTRGARRREVRSFIFTDSVLDYLVHLHLLPGGSKSGLRSLSVGEFLDLLRGRYGFHVDTAPPGMTISNELLQANRRTLERRLRDLGLLVGVNDAEAMKRLRPRFEPRTEEPT